MYAFRSYSLIFTHCLIAIAAASSLYADSSAYKTCIYPALSYSDPFRFSVTAIAGDSYGIDNRRASVGLFYAPFILPIKWQSFLDLQGHYLAHGRWAANAGTGLRWLDTHKNRVWGINCYYDFREGRTGSFNQIGFGAESLGECWDYRLNCYLPISAKTRYTTKMFPMKNFRFGYYRRYECAMKGLDTEICRRFEICGPLNWYVGLGTYYYRRESIDHLWGIQSRLALFYGQYGKFEIKVSYDRVYHTKIQGIFEFTFPFEIFHNTYKNSEKICRGWLLQPVERKQIMVLKTHPTHQERHLD